MFYGIVILVDEGNGNTGFVGSANGWREKDHSWIERFDLGHGDLIVSMKSDFLVDSC
jgi:hypothetical protein